MMKASDLLGLVFLSVWHGLILTVALDYASSDFPTRHFLTLCGVCLVEFVAWFYILQAVKSEANDDNR